MLNLLVLDGLMGALSAMMQPLYWAVSGILVGAHWLLSHVMDPNSGVTWALSIILLTVVIRTLLVPLFMKQINSARNMQLLQPKMTELQKKYGHDRERLGRETMQLYRDEGVNPMASCLPLLLQMPIFLALYRVLEGVSVGAIRGYFFRENPDVVKSLQQAELFGAGLADRVLPIDPFGPNQIVGAMLAVAMIGVFTVTQLQLTRKNMPPESQVGQAAQMQKMMLYFFPLVYAMSATFVPIGVLVYWLTSNIWTMAQQGILIRSNPAPNTPAYIDWEERMRAKGKDPDAIMRARVEKRRRNKSAAPSRPVGGQSQGQSTSDETKVVRQQVTRQTVRTTENGRRVVTRQQPRQKSRSARKKK